jgi:hypothetical protein
MRTGEGELVDAAMLEVIEGGVVGEREENEERGWQTCSL